MLNKPVKQLLQKFGPLSILCLGLILGGLLILLKPETMKVPPQEKKWPINTILIKASRQNPELLLYARIESHQQATLRSPATAYVQATPALEGAIVQKGQLLLKLDPLDAQLFLEQKKAEVDFAQAALLVEKNKNNTDLASLELEEQLVNLVNQNVNRELKLSKQKLGSQSRVDDAELAAVREKLGRASRELSIDNYQARIKQLEADLNRATADKDLAALNVKRTQIVAPFAGIINLKSVAIGDRVSINDPLLKIYAIDALEARAQLATHRLALIQDALNHNISLNGTILDAPKLQVKLNRLAGEVESNEGGIDALFTILGDKTELRLGQAVKIKLQLPALDNVYTVPSTALFEIDNKHYLYTVVSDEEAHRLKIHQVTVKGTIFEDNKTYYLVEAQNLGHATIMSTRLPLARDKLKVEIRNAN